MELTTLDWIFTGIFFLGLGYLRYLTKKGDRLAKKIGLKKWSDIPPYKDIET